MPGTLTQAEARQHKLQATRGNMRSLELILEHLLGGDITLDNLEVALGTFDAIVGGDASFGITGEAAAQGGAIAVVAGASSTAGNDGGAVTVAGGVPGATSAGGAVSATGGIGGATSGAGGAASLVGGAATAGNSAGGEAFVDGGAGQGTSAGGAVNVTSGAAEAGTSGVSPGASGAVIIESGVAGTTDTGTGGASGTLTIRTAAGGLLSGDAANAAGAGGALAISTGAGGAHAAGAAAGGAGGAITITAGAGGEDTEDVDGSGGIGGDITITAGAGGDGETSGAGGDIVLVPGTIGTNDGGTAPIGGAIFLRKNASADMPVFFHTDVFPSAVTADATLTVAQIFGQVLVVDDGGGATSTQTLPTGTAMSNAAPTNMVAGDSFYFHVVNEETDAAGIAKIATATGFVLQGSGDIEELDASTNPSSAMFLVRFVSTNNWTCTRVA